LGVKEWVTLGQAPSPHMSELAARNIPPLLLPRLLLASGLSLRCVLTTLARLDGVPKSAAQADLVYQDLVAPQAQIKWGVGKTRTTKDVKAKLLRRVRAYLRSYDIVPRAEEGATVTTSSVAGPSWEKKGTGGEDPPDPNPSCNLSLSNMENCGSGGGSRGGGATGRAAADADATTDPWRGLF
ncbi:unnamed protein product, partial [Discosporangium mesarthrocarpum]